MNRTKKILMLMLTLIMFASALALSASAANAPSAPATLTATQNTSAIKLTWSKVSGATGYRIYYKLPADLSWRTAVSSLTATSKTFSNLPSAQRYTFAVRSYSKTSTGTVWGGYKQLQTATKPVTPKKLTAAQTTNAIQLNWSEVHGATGYRIYYKPTSTTTWKIAVSTTDDNTHTFPNLASAKKYDFAVRPYIKTASGVIWGAYKEIGTATKPVIPEGINVQPNKTKKTLTISWSKSERADCYRIYYMAEADAVWKTLVNSTSSVSYTHKWDGKRYHFAVMPMVKTTSGYICGSYITISSYIWLPYYTTINYEDLTYNTTGVITAPTITTTRYTTTWATLPPTTAHPTTTAPTTEPQEKRIELTLDNWDEYFEVYEEVNWGENAFGEPTEFYGINLYFALKDEYLDKCDAEFACEYSINTVDCKVKYDVINEKIEILSTSNPRGEYLSTFRGYAYDNYIESSYVGAEDKKGIIEFEKYNFLGVTRINGYIEFYN